MAGSIGDRWARKVRDRLAGRGRKSNRAFTSSLCVITPSPAHQVPTPGQTDNSSSSAIQACRDAIQLLNKQELSLQSQVTIAETEARTLLRLGDRSGAETSLKKREIVLREIDRLHRTRMSLLSQILLVETASTRQVAVEALASGVAAHRKITGKLFEETQLEKLEEALIEQASFETEVSELLGQGFEALTSFDDETNASLRKSLEELEQDEVMNAIAETHGFGGHISPILSALQCSPESYQGVVSALLPPIPAPYPLVEELPSPRREEEKHFDLSEGKLSNTMMTTMASPMADGMEREGVELAGM